MSKLNELIDFLKPRKEWVYEPGEKISEEEVKYIREYTGPKRQMLFKPHGQVSKANPSPKYKISYHCTAGDHDVVEEWSKTKILNKNEGFICEECKNRLENERAAELEREYEKKEQLKPARTEEYIETYLNPNNSWKENIKPWKKFSLIDRYDIDINKVSDYIKQMNYYDFLKTPYWKAVTAKKMFQSNYQCQMCGSTGRLNVHHSDYTIHGKEVNNLNKLICLCEDCHRRFHDKLTGTT